MSSSKCPFHHLWASKVPATAEAESEGQQKSVDEPQTFVTAQAAEAGAASLPPPAAPELQQQAVCPLGFSSSQGRRLGQFHCPLCKCLYHDCAVASCGHRFCAGCIARHRDCPICGADITSVEPDIELQAVVDRYLDAHAATHTLWELEEQQASAGANAGAAAAAGCPMAGHGGTGVSQQAAGGGTSAQTQRTATLPAGEERGRASFLLALGLRALAAGNASAAQARLQQSAAELRQQVEWGDTSCTDTAAAPQLHIRLATVLGALGDCCRASGEGEAALRYYQESLDQLQQEGESTEALEAAAVSTNKVGEVLHMAGDVAAAAQRYSHALELRRRVLARVQAGAGPEQAGAGPAPPLQYSQPEVVEAVVNVATCLVKLAHAAGERTGEQLAVAAAKPGSDKAVGRPEALLREAAALLAGVEGGMGQQQPSVQRKYGMLRSFLAAEN